MDTETNTITASSSVPSSWISSILYRKAPDGTSYLALILRDEPVALLYGPHVPPWLKGLVKAGTGRRSVGLAFNRLVKGKGYNYQRVEGEEKVNELRRMMK